MTVTTGARVTRSAGIDVFRLDLQHLLFEGLHLDVGAELARDHRGGLVVQRAVDRHHQPPIHQLLEDVLRFDVELRGEVGDRHTFGQRDGARDGRRRDRRGDAGRHARLVAAGRAAGPLAAGPMMHRRPVAGMPGRGGGAGGRTGCDGSGRGPPIGAGTRRQASARALRRARGRAGAAGRRGALPGGRLRLPVGACDAAAPAAAGGRTSSGRRGGAGGAWPVRGSSTRSRSVGGTMRPVGGGITRPAAERRWRRGPRRRRMGAADVGTQARVGGCVGGALVR